MNRVYNASAGTGKTYQITALYEELVVTEDVDPCQILLMTFTINAANELRTRVRQRLQKALHRAESEGNDAQAEKIARALTRLPAAPIGTIHSFCTRILREHALEVGLSPSFTVMEENERTERLEQICRETLMAHLENDPAFRTFCSGAHLIGNRQGFGSSMTETVPRLIDQAGSLGLSLEEAEGMLPAPLPPLDLHGFHLLLDRLRALSKRSPKVEEAMHLLSELLDEVDATSQLADAFDARFSGHFSYGEARSIYPKFKALKEEARAREAYRKRYPAAQAFARYLQSVAQAFKQFKHENGVLDFNDLLLLSRTWLERNPGKPHFDAIIIDEVQDTSRIQFEIVRSLWNDRNRLILCGDRKQSIYTWRGADPQVMPDFEELILAQGGERVALKTSYRSQAQLLHLINDLFSSVYGPEHYTEEAHLIPCPEFGESAPGSGVEFLQPEVSDGTPHSLVLAEMEAVARRIQLLVNGKNEWQPARRFNGVRFAPIDEGNRYRYSDVLILLRRTTHQAALEQALRLADIPYTLGGKGRGLFERQEARDVSLFLNTITHPDDAPALIGFLRSPWMGFSDQQIATLSHDEQAFSIERLQQEAPRVTEMIARYRTLLSTHLASELVRLLIRETGYDAVLAGLPRGAQRMANLRSVIDWLRSNERGARVTPADAARLLAQQIQDTARVPEAALPDPVLDAVTIMTVHSAKGLTRRVVVLPDLNAKSKSDTSFAQIHIDDGQTPKLEVKVTAPNTSRAHTPGFKQASAHAKAMRELETNNLFYVAMTRARDLVITSAPTEEKAKGWLESLLPFMGKAIRTLSHDDLRKAHQPPELPHRPLPTPSMLQAALSERPPAPPLPTLRRISATRLAHHTEPEIRFLSEGVSKETTAAQGSLAHAVLEQLALNGWEGDVEPWIERLQDQFPITDRESAALRPRIEKAREQMRTLTSGYTTLRPELPFVLKEERLLIDGTIDLLCLNDNEIQLFDYKFTDADDAQVLALYREQMMLYLNAATQLYPSYSKPRAALIIVSSDAVRILDLAIS